MGRNRTPRFRVETNTVGSMGWNPEYGRPTDGYLARWVLKFNEELEPGGCNEHLGTKCRVTTARIVEQASGEVKATYEAPAFQVV